MAKKLYIVETQRVITQTWKYEFETDKDLKTSFQIMEYIDNKDIEGHCVSEDDELIEENFSCTFVHPVEEKA